MRFPGLVIMGINNLRRRKLRAVLVVLGAIADTASIVAMVSLGTGLDQVFMEQISSQGDLTTIDVYSGSSYGGAVIAGGGGNSRSSDPTYVIDDVIAQFDRLPHVSRVSLALETNVVMRQGIYEAQYLSLMGVNRSFLEQIPLGEGRPLKPEEVDMVMDNTVQQNFYNPKTGHGCWNTDKVPDTDFMDRPLFVTFDMDAYFQARNGSVGSQEDGQTPVKPPKKYMLNATGMVEGGPDDWNSYSHNMYTDINGLKVQLHKVFKRGTVIPGQSINKEGRPLNYLVYNRARMFVDDMEYTQEMQKQIADMGFQADSQAGWMESTKQQFSVIQATPGDIGAVSLLVIIIGIASTMMISICERTKEVRVMKIPGCDMGNIRNMSLAESGFTGFIGDVAGILLSYSISVVISRFVNLEEVDGLAGSLPRIPPWLSAAAVVFATFVGMAAGFMPAMRAVKLGPLAAIQNEWGKYAGTGDCFSKHS